jgi:hypothetical protein
MLCELGLDFNERDAADPEFFLLPALITGNVNGGIVDCFDVSKPGRDAPIWVVQLTQVLRLISPAVFSSSATVVMSLMIRPFMSCALLFISSKALSQPAPFPFIAL